MPPIDRRISGVFAVALTALTVFMWQQPSHATKPAPQPQHVTTSRVVHLDAVNGPDAVIVQAALWGGTVEVSCGTDKFNEFYTASVFVVSDASVVIQAWSPTFRYYDTEWSIGMDVASVATASLFDGFGTQVFRAVRNNRTLRIEASAGVTPQGLCHVSYTIDESDNVSS